MEEAFATKKRRTALLGVEWRILAVQRSIPTLGSISEQVPQFTSSGLAEGNFGVIKIIQAQAEAVAGEWDYFLNVLQVD